MKKKISFLAVLFLSIFIMNVSAKAETYYFDNTYTKWEHVSVWAWSEDDSDPLFQMYNGFSAWPGIELSKDSATGYYVWECEYPSTGKIAVMFNDGDESGDWTTTTCDLLARNASAGKVCVPTVVNTKADEEADFLRQEGRWYGEWKSLSSSGSNNASNFKLSLNQTSFGYTGDYIKPVVTVKTTVNGKEVTLKKGVDYTVSYSNFKNPGTAKITVTGKGLYSGQKTINFTIRPIDISKFTLTLKQNSFGYTGEYIKPVVTVKGIALGKEVTLTNWKDYKVTYSNFKNAGTAKITVTGRGIYGGSKTINFTIRPIDLSKCTASLNQTSFTYTGDYIKPVVNVKGTVNGKTVALVNWKDYKLTYSNFKNPGKATITVTGRGNFTGTKTLTFTIKPSWVKDAKLGTVTNSSAKLTWTKCAGVTGYEIYRATSKSGTYTKVGTVTTNTNTYTNTGLKSWTKYYYKVRAYKTIGTTKVYGSYSSVVTVAKACASGHSCSAATCTASAVCKNCGYVKQKALGHSVNSAGKCTRCGKVIKSNFQIIKDSIIKKGLLYEGQYEIVDYVYLTDGNYGVSIVYNTNTKKMEFYCIITLDIEGDTYYGTVGFTLGEGDTKIDIEQDIYLSSVIGAARVYSTVPVATFIYDGNYAITVNDITNSWDESDLKEITKLNNKIAFYAFDTVLEEYTGYGLNELGFKKY